MSNDAPIRDHKAWLGYVQQDGLVVSPTALVDAQVVLDRNTLPMQERFLPFTNEVTDNDDNVLIAIADFPKFTCDFLGWPADCLYGLDSARPVPDALAVALPDYGETLAPSFAFKDPRPKDAAQPWLLLVQSVPLATDLDARIAADERGWSASPTQRMERLLRETKVPIGVLFNGTQIRLLYAPHGENSGNITFTVRHMTEVTGRPILAALYMLLREACSGATPSDARLPALLRRSREYQSTVSTTLAQQVLDSLYELLRGFQAADERAKGELLRAVLAKNPDDVYAGLLNVLMRMVFLLFAEDRGIVPTDPKSRQPTETYVRYYSIHGLFERLRTDAERYPDTMDQRYGAWAQLLALFRAVHDGCKHPQMEMPARHGHLFDPDRFKFLEGRTLAEPHLPLLSDGTIFRVLHKLFILDGERLSYRTLDVQEIGSVYQTIMGFGIEVAHGQSIALKGKRKNGSIPASPVVNLEILLAAKPAERAKWLKENAETELPGEAEKKLKAATSVDDLLAALEKRVDRCATPGPVSKGGLVLQPTDERRRSGSHYTPRSFTEPIVCKTLQPILKRLGEQPTPAQLLELKICDLAVGSAAFLVETCRQLGDALVKAWRHHGTRPPLPDDETEELLAMRTVVQCCLYGVDRNPMAVDLAKLSLWLVTLAKDHPFTFVDHAIRCGDALVGLSRGQIEDFTWRETKTSSRHFFSEEVRKRTAAALRERQKLLGLGDDYGTPQLKREKLEKADELLDLVRFIGDAAVTAFFAADKDKVREVKREELAECVSDYLGKGDLKQRPTEEVKALRGGKFPVTPFHWEIEFPEVFDRENSGFDGIVGNPPYAGKNTLITSNHHCYVDWVKAIHEESHGSADLVAHFFRRAFTLLRADGCFGLIATKTIQQGDTRSTGLRWICAHGGTIYSARRRFKWPGQAAVIVSVVNVAKGELSGPYNLDGRSVPKITAYLFHAGGSEDPSVLKANADLAFQGSIILGLGFTFDDEDSTETANPVELVQKLVAQNPKNAECIFPYINGEEINEFPTSKPRRFVINFAEMSESEARCWPDLFTIVEDRVKPDRAKLRGNKDAERRRDYWWQWGRYTPALYQVTAKMQKVIARSLTSKHHPSFTFLNNSPSIVFDQTLLVFAFELFSSFAVLISRFHEVWSLFLGASMGETPRYSLTDCFETFPFPAGFEINAELETAGKKYYDFRAALMVRNNEGLTKTYNRFHDPEERSPDILKLRDLHADIDAVVLTAYGWGDLISKCTCEFLLEYEDEDSDEEEGKIRKRKKPWRYRWPDEVRDEVLARLLKLNAERAKEEELYGQIAAAQKPKPKKATKKAVVQKEQIRLPLNQPRKHSRGINFKRGAIASYAVNRLCDRPEFGRIQMEKVFYGAQCIVGIDLEMDFKPYENGPFDEEIHKIESLAKKEQWFDSVPRQGGIGIEYHRGAKIEDRYGAAKSILGDRLGEFDRILNFMAKMDSEQAGIWTTVHFVWNGLILAKKPVADDAIVTGFYEFHESKKSIEERRVRACIKWLRDEGFVPKGIVFAKPKAEKQQPELPTDFRLPASQALLYTTNLVLTLLSEAGGSIAWPRLLDAYVLATNPKLMQRFAPVELSAQAKAWAVRWNETVQDGLLLPSLNQLGARNITVTEGNDGPVFHLLDGPHPSLSEDVRYDAWIALQVAAILTPDTVPIPQRTKWTKEARELVLT